MRDRRRSRLLSLLCSVAFVAAWWLLLAPPALGGETSYISVSGKSMEPTYITGDLVMVRKQGSYQPGDIVAFRADGGVVIHRIVGGDGATGYTLQGDNNSWRDPWNPTNANVVGKAWFRMPGASKWLLALTHPAVLAIAVTAVLASAAVPAARSNHDKQKQAPIPVPSSRSSMELADLRRTIASVPGRTLAVSTVAAATALLLAVPATLAWLDDAERTSFVEHARYQQTAELSYTFHVDRTTLYPDGTVGPVDATTPTAPKIFAKPARSLDVTVDYRFAGAEGDVNGTYAVDAVIGGDAGWQTTVPVVGSTTLEGTEAHITFPIDLGTVVALARQIDDEAGAASRSLQVQVQARFSLSTAVAGSTVDETFTPPFTLTYDGSSWQVATPLHAEEIQRLGDDVTERVELAGVAVSQLRWLVVPAIALAALTIALLTAAVRRNPTLTVEALLRRPGISVIDLERPPADAELAVPLASAEGIRRVAERDGGLVLRYDDGLRVHLYARHDDRVYSYSPEVTAKAATR